MSSTDTHHVYLSSEVTRFPSGWRNVTVLKSGDKWVTLQCGMRKARVPKSVWLKILTGTIKFNRRHRNSEDTNA